MAEIQSYCFKTEIVSAVYYLEDFEELQNSLTASDNLKSEGKINLKVVR